MGIHDLFEGILEVENGLHGLIFLLVVPAFGTNPIHVFTLRAFPPTLTRFPVVSSCTSVGAYIPVSLDKCQLTDLCAFFTLTTKDQNLGFFDPDLFCEDSGLLL